MMTRSVAKRWATDEPSREAPPAFARELADSSLGSGSPHVWLPTELRRGGRVPLAGSPNEPARLAPDGRGRRHALGVQVVGDGLAGAPLGELDHDARHGRPRLRAAPEACALAQEAKG